MTIGKILLYAKGKENIIVSQNSDITFFKNVFTKKNNIAFSYVPQYFKSTPNFGRRVTVNISKSADLIKDISLFVELPDIQLSNHTSLPENIKKISWANKIGLTLIKLIDIEIGGILINRYYNDWLNIDYETNNLDEGLNKLIGKDIKILQEYTNGKNSYKLHIPLNLFFNKSNNLALPLISLSKQDIKIHLEFNDLSKCYKESPTHYFEIDSYYCLFKKNEIIRQNVNGMKAIGQFIYFDIENKRIYYNKIFNIFKIPSNLDTKYKIIGDETNYYVIPKVNSIILSDESYFKTNLPNLKESYVIVNYIFLDSCEKWIFKNNNFEYIIPLVQNILSTNLTSINSIVKLNFTNPHKILFWRAQLNSESEINNHYNYTTYPLTLKPNPIILKNKIIINSIPRTEINNYEYYNYLQTYINDYLLTEGVHQYSFCVFPKNTDPTGTLNFSKIDDSYIELNLNNLVNYQTIVNIKAYGIYYNILVIKNGTCSLKFTI